MFGWSLEVLLLVAHSYGQAAPTGHVIGACLPSQSASDVSLRTS